MKLPATQDHRRASLRRFGHHVQLRQLPVQGQPGVEGEGRRRHLGAVAGRRRRQGQRRRRRVRASRSRVRSATSSSPMRCRTRWPTRRCRTRPASSCSRARSRSRPPPPRADWKNAKDFNLVITNAPGDDAWPITATNFILMYKQPKDAAAREGRARLLQVGVRERPAAGQGARLRAAAAGAGAADRGVLGG